jgi:phospholipid/cholesterol/gamma-HCH transport system substrate-binding protein
MQKLAPSRAQIAVMVVFALSCFALLLYLWKTFGGATPLAPEGYRFQVDFDEATQLSDTAEVRISGVTVGRVVKSDLGGDRTRATIQIEERYAPVPSDTRAILRQKTLLGETYVELTPGTEGAPPLPDNGRLPRRQVTATVELDEILRELDEPTRVELRRVVRELAEAVEGREEDLSAALGNLEPFAHDTSRLLALLEGQRPALRRLVRDTGVVFGELGRRQGELAGLVRATDRVLGATARRDADLAESVRILPTTLRELRPTEVELEAFFGDAAPVVRALRPAGRALAPALRDTVVLAPDVEALFGDLDRAIEASRRGLPAAGRIVRAAHPVFRLLVPVLREALPVVDYAGAFRSEVLAAFVNVAAATQGSERPTAGSDPLHYIRVIVPFGSEGLVAADRRYGSNRHNPYFSPRALERLARGLEAFDCQNTGNPQNDEPAPPCRVQEPFEFRGRRLAFPHVTRDP